MSEKKRAPERPPPPNINTVSFDQREKLHERGNKLSNLAQLTEPIDPSKNYSETPDELW